jgi:uncharacterized damage-inducible protein DinB
MSRKALLEHQIKLAFSDDPEMSLLASVEPYGNEIMDKRISEDTWSVAEILYHVALCKISYCKEGWGEWSGEIEKPFGDLQGMRKLLVRSNDHLLDCLGTLDEDDLDKPLNLSFHGESARHFFSVMIVHDAAHAAQIRATLRHCAIRKGGFYPVA